MGGRKEGGLVRSEDEGMGGEPSRGLSGEDRVVRCE